MTVLVTGGAGFLGSFVVDALVEAGQAPVILDLHEAPRRGDRAGAGLPVVRGGIEDLDFLLRTMTERDVERVIHLAGFLQFGCAQDPWRAVEVNVRGTLNVLEAARRTGATRIVFASSGAVYGPRTDAIREDSPILPGVSLYGATKFLGEVLLRHYRELHGISFVALRYWGIYGPGEVQSPGVAEVIKRIESTIGGRDVVVDEVGADERRHFLFVKDAARATVKALLAPGAANGVYNIAGGPDHYVTFGEFHRVIKRLCPGAGDVVFRGTGQDRGRVDIARAERELGYRPRFSLEEGIREDIDFIRSNREKEE